MRNVAGELMAVIKALEYITAHRIVNPIQIYYDYIGIGAWANGEWKAKTEFTKYYM